MVVGAASFFLYSSLCTWLMLRKKIDAAPATIGSLIVWLAAAMATWALFLR
jgi:hypothetical protein